MRSILLQCIDRGGRRLAGVPSRPRAGFTLVEIVVVIVLMGALFAIAVPRIDFARTNINAATQQAALTLMKAHRDAIQRQHNVVVAFDTVQMLMRVHADADNDGVIDAGEPLTQTKLEDGVRFRLGGATGRAIGSGGVTFTQQQNGLPAVTFTRAGSASEFGGFYLSSVSAGQAGGRPTDTRAFEVERAIGRFERYYWSNGSWTREW